MIMVKTLRYSLLAMLAMVCNVAFADAYKVLTFPDGNSGQISNYTSTWTVTIGTDTWSIENFNNNKNEWAYIKCGRNKNASVASIATTFAVDKAIDNIVVTIDAITASSVNSMKLIVASDADFANAVETVDASAIAKGDIMFKPTTPAANMYYKLVFDCAAGTKNGLIQISKVEYYEQGNEPDIVDISNTPETAYSVAKALELIAAGKGLATEVYVKGFITAITEVSEQYGNATYNIGDTQANENVLTAFRGRYLGNKEFTSADQITVGDEVIVYGQLMEYKKDDVVTPELAQGNYIYSLNGKTTTGIENIEAAQDAKQVIYTIGGQQLQKAQKGLNIINGKKVVVK